MYEFRVIDITKLDIDDFNSFENKVPFTTVEWLNYLKKLKGIKPVILNVLYEGNIIGYFTGGIIRFMGIKVLGSPFWGWIGQHMGFDLRAEVVKSALIDDLIDFAENKMKCDYVQITDLKFSHEDIKAVTHKLISGEQYRTCYIDLTLPRETLFRNLRSGYRTCVRKFDKDYGTIEEDYSESFIDEHGKQLREVFNRQRIKAPNYHKKMHLLFTDDSMSKGAVNSLGVYSIKALLPDAQKRNINIASSYYIHNGYLAMFASNASYSKYLKTCPNQALMWRAICEFKAVGLKVLDMGGSGNYKLNYGTDWDPKPIIIYAKSKYAQFAIIGIKRIYIKVFHLLGKVKAFVTEKLRTQASKTTQTDSMEAKNTVLIACGHPLKGHPNGNRMLNFGKMLKSSYNVIALGYVCDGGEDLSYEIDDIKCWQFSFDTDRSMRGKIHKHKAEKQKLTSFLRTIPTPAYIITAAGFYDVLQGVISRYARERHCPVIQSVCEWYDKSNDNYRGVMGKAKYLLNRYQLIFYNVKCGNTICISSLLDNYYRGRGCHSIRITTTVDISDFETSIIKDGDGGRLRLLYAGSPKKKDFLGNIIEGIALLSPGNKSLVQLDIYGITRKQAEAELGLSKQTLSELEGIVYFHGRVEYEKVKGALREADFSVLLRPDARYANAGFPTKIGESMASGVPVIANITSDLSMYIIDSKTGLICKDESKQSFAEVLQRAISLQRDDVNNMKIEARKMAEEQFEYSIFSQVVLDFISQCRR